MSDNDELLAQAQSVESTPTTPEASSIRAGYFYAAPRGPLLPAWGSRQRDIALWRYALDNRNTLWQSAANALTAKLAATPYEVRGENEEADAGEAAAILSSANKGAGWRNFVSQVVFAFLTHDTLGAVIEIIGPGDPLGPLWGAPTGINVLDTFSCFATGIPSWPILYYDTASKVKHEPRFLHKDRVHIITDQPVKHSYINNAGLCALSRAISAVDQAINTNRYVSEALDTNPPPGIVVTNNVTPVELSSALTTQDQAKRNDLPGALADYIVFKGLSAENKVSVEFVPFADPPEAFDLTAYKEIFAKEIAAALGIDIQEFWQISGGGALGTSTQSEVLERKGKGQTLAILYKELEQLSLCILPEGFNLEFVFQDDEQDAQRAAVASQQMATTTSAVNSGMVSPEQGRAYLILTDSTWARVLDDENTEVASDSDPSAREIETEEGGAVPGAILGSAVTGGGAPGQTEDLPQNIEAAASLNGAQIAAALQVLDGVSTGATAAAVGVELLIAVGIAPAIARRMVADTVANKPSATTLKMYTRRKAWSETRADFINDLAAVFERDHTGRRGGIRLSRSIRGLLRRYSEPTYRDGMSSSGVERDNLTTRDRMRIQTWQAAQGKFVTDLIQGQQSAREAATPAAARSKAEAWAGKSLRALLNTAALTADPAAMKRWDMDPAKQNCITCQQLNGQIHSAAEWNKSGWEPGITKLDCHGDRCGCVFEDMDAGTPARGDLSKVKPVFHKGDCVAIFAKELDNMHRDAR